MTRHRFRNPNFNLVRALATGAIGQPKADPFAPYTRSGERGVPRWFPSGTQALRRFLKLVAQDRGIETVWVPAFICEEVAFAVHAESLKIRYYPVTETLSPNLDFTKLTRGKDVVLFVSYFGLPVVPSQFFDDCKKSGVLSIDDNAHGFLSEGADLPFGLRGDFGLVSVRKSLGLHEGAMAFGLHEFEVAHTERRSTKFIRGGELKGLAIRTAQSLVGPTLWKGLKKSVKVQRAKKPEKAFDQRETLELSHSMHAQADWVPSKVFMNLCTEFYRRREKTRRSFETLKARIGELGFDPVFNGELASGVVPWALPIWVEYGKEVQALKKLLDHGIEAFHWPKLPNEMDRSEGFQKLLPRKSVILLPCY